MICKTCQIQYSNTNHKCCPDLELIHCKVDSISICNVHLLSNHTCLEKVVLFALLQISCCKVIKLQTCNRDCIYHVRTGKSSYNLLYSYFERYQSNLMTFSSSKYVDRVQDLIKYFTAFVSKHKD